jgi:hypothetical protein
MQTAPPNLLADYLYLRQTAVVKQAIDTARTSVPSGGHSSSYLCQHDSVFAAQDRPLGKVDRQCAVGGSFSQVDPLRTLMVARVYLGLPILH